MKDCKRLPDGELQVMQALWACGEPATRREIEAHLSQAMAPTTLLTFLSRLGEKGFVTDVMKNRELSYSYFYTCGPEPMLKALYKASHTSGQMSFEERMGCGFGACMGCSCKTLTGNKRICKDGPVMKKEEILWD